jgi:hypothetical protein
MSRPRFYDIPESQQGWCLSTARSRLALLFYWVYTVRVLQVAEKPCVHKLVLYDVFPADVFFRRGHAVGVYIALAV